MWVHLERHIYYFNMANGVPIWQAVFSKLDRFNTPLFCKRLWRIRALCGRCFDGGATLRKLHATLHAPRRQAKALLALRLVDKLCCSPADCAWELRGSVRLNCNRRVLQR